MAMAVGASLIVFFRVVRIYFMVFFMEMGMATCYGSMVVKVGVIIGIGVSERVRVHALVRGGARAGAGGGIAQVVELREMVMEVGAAGQEK